MQGLLCKARPKAEAERKKKGKEHIITLLLSADKWICDGSKASWYFGTEGTESMHKGGAEMQNWR